MLLYGLTVFKISLGLQSGLKNNFGWLLILNIDAHVNPNRPKQFQNGGTLKMPSVFQPNQQPVFL